MTSGSSDLQGRDPFPDGGEGHDPELVPLEGDAISEDDDSLTESDESPHPDEPVIEPDTEPAIEPGADDGSDDQLDDGLRWDIVFDDPANPFTSRLMFTEANEQVLWWDLDPVTINELLTALTTVKGAQLAALTGQPVSLAVPVLGDDSDDAPATPSAATRPRKPKNGEPDERSWVWRHKLATVTLFILALMFIIPAFSLRAGV